MATGGKATDHLSFHSSARRAEDERGDRSDGTLAGAVLVLVLAGASMLVLMEALVSLLTRLSNSLF